MSNQGKNDELDHDEQQTEDFDADDGEEQIGEDQFGFAGDRLLRVEHVERRFTDDDRNRSTGTRRVFVLVFIDEDLIDIGSDVRYPETAELCRAMFLGWIRVIDRFRQLNGERRLSGEQTTVEGERLSEIEIEECEDTVELVVMIPARQALADQDGCRQWCMRPSVGIAD